MKAPIQEPFYIQDVKEERKLRVVWSSWFSFVDRIFSGIGITKSYESPLQAVVSAGGFAVSHGLGLYPRIVQAYLVCETAEAGYGPLDEVLILSQGLAVVLGNPDITVRYDSAVNVFSLPDKNTGVSTPLTNANWKVLVKVWA